MSSLLSGPFGRFIKSTLSLAAGMAISKYANNAWYLAATPLLQMVGKALRDKWPDDFAWIPF